MNVKNVQNINQNKLIKFLQSQNANAVKRHLNAIRNRNTSQKKAYINAQLENLPVNNIVSNLQRSGLVLNKNFTKNQLVRNANKIGILGNKLKAAGMFKNPYLKLLFTRTNTVKNSLNKDPSGENLRRIVNQITTAKRRITLHQIPFL